MSEPANPIQVFVDLHLDLPQQGPGSDATTLRALGLPTSMFTVIFAIGRMPGWIAHWLDLMNDPERKIGRPRQIYTGATDCKLP